MLSTGPVGTFDLVIDQLGKGLVQLAQEPGEPHNRCELLRLAALLGASVDRPPSLAPLIADVVRGLEAVGVPTRSVRLRHVAALWEAHACIVSAVADVSIGCAPRSDAVAAARRRLAEAFAA